MGGMGAFSVEMSGRITALPEVWYGRSKEMVQALDLRKLTGVSAGVRFVDLAQYAALDLMGQGGASQKEKMTGGLFVNVLKTKASDPNHVYIAISPDIHDSALVHQLAHVLDYLGGSKLMPGLAKPLSFDLEIPVEHIEHPHEFGYWLDDLYTRFEVSPDADDAIVVYLYKNDMLLKGSEIEGQQRTVLKSKSDRIMRFLSEKSGEIDEMIRELPGYIGSRVNKD